MKIGDNMIKQIDWERYNQLLKKSFQEMTQEKDFCKYMYHVEEAKAGLL